MIAFRTAVLAGALTVAIPAFAQRGATGPVADLNAQALAVSDTAPDKSVEIAEKAQQAARAAHDVRGEAEAWYLMSAAHRTQSLLELARREASESIRLYTQANDRWGQAQGYNMLGLVETDDGRFADSLESHLKALAIREADGDKEGLAFTYNNLGNAYRNMGEYQKALEYHQRGLAIKVELGNRPSEAFSHQNIGNVYFAMKDYPAALAAYQRSLAIREQIKDQRMIAASLNAIGSVEAVTDPRVALKTYERSLALRSAVGDERGKMAVLMNIADVHQKLSRYADARAALAQAMALGNKIDAPLMRASALKTLSEIDAAQGRYADAYTHHLAYQQINDQVFNQQTAERFHRLDAAREAERKQQQIQLLERENALREAELANVRMSQMALGVIGGLVLVSLALLYARYRLKQASESRLRIQATELADALDRVQTLKGLLPICAWCKKIRDDGGGWTALETYVRNRSAAEFTHCICPSCYDAMSDRQPGATGRG